MTAACREKIAQRVGFCYLALMALHIPVWRTLHCEDLLAPALLAIVVARGDVRTLRRDPVALALALFLLLAGLATLTHFKPFPGNSYHWCVYAYLASTFIFFRGTAFRTDVLFLLGAVFLALAAAACCFDLVMAWTGVGPVRFSLISTQMDATAMPFLRQRFTFTFGNPNLLGSFYALPFALLLPRLLSKAATWRWRQALTAGAALALAVIPLLLTISKHALLSLALLAAFVAIAVRQRFRWAAALAGAAIVAGGLIGGLSIAYPVFPLQKTWPFINTECPGMYMIHQGAYARMAVHTPAKLLFGHGGAAAKNLYPAFTNRDSARRTLAHYNALPDFDSFVTFMDPHNEYLRLVILFGLPAALAMFAFWCLTAASPPDRQAAGLIVAFTAALMFCCLWDDLLSKRWIWITAAILTNRHLTTTKNNTAAWRNHECGDNVNRPTPPCETPAPTHSN
ncbi:MAG TPA: hypothetical protein PLH67_03940 [Lentisphaeria bacterium]|nr:hypothetical protein [Lentisphaeria bacterium]